MHVCAVLLCADAHSHTALSAQDAATQQMGGGMREQQGAARVRPPNCQRCALLCTVACGLFFARPCPPLCCMGAQASVHWPTLTSCAAFTHMHGTGEVSYHPLLRGRPIGCALRVACAPVYTCMRHVLRGAGRLHPCRCASYGHRRLHRLTVSTAAAAAAGPSAAPPLFPCLRRPLPWRRTTGRRRRQTCTCTDDVLMY